MFNKLKNKAIWIGGIIGFVYSLSFVLLGIYNIKHGGYFYDSLKNPFFYPINLSILFIIGIFWFLGLAGDGQSFVRTFWGEILISCVLTIIFWTILGTLIAWLIKIRDKYTNKKLFFIFLITIFLIFNILTLPHLLGFDGIGEAFEAIQYLLGIKDRPHIVGHVI
jgi:hypothetical protein